MQAFRDAIDALYGDPHLSLDATYTPAETGVDVAVRVIVDAPTVDASPFGQPIRSDAVVIRLRTSEIAAVAAGDTITLGAPFDEARVVQGVPECDRLRLEWILDTAPVEA